MDDRRETIMTVAWDSFARAGLERTTHSNIGHFAKCQWCGQVRVRLYSYVSTDARLPAREKLFCNLGCFRSYYY